VKVWAIANQKGGVAKTTTTVSLGGLLAGWGFRVLLVDMDPHGSMTSYFRYDPDNMDVSVYNLFQANAEKQALRTEELICDTGVQGLSLLPASLAQATLDRQAGKLNGMGLILKGGLKQLQDEYDYVLIDCPPLLGVLLINALAACDQLIIPVQTEFLALKGLERMIHTLKMILKARAQPLPYVVVPTLYDQRTRAGQDSLQVLRQNYPDHLWPGVIPVDTKLRDASKSGLPATEYAPHCRAVVAYSALLEYLLRHSGQDLASAENTIA
jgi:chromosome partitioning protein